ncbi:Nucleotide-binding universal stress protein, UspA family [Chitinophaga costaii]|uniref:Nucleotide-binding universal stress protein, UspA family n=1 Tax=Chitinophaga costaii TaxID=1335309 RepID=A0A1C4DI76_9BACT|nr:universal stress protein [Chitinophaga costaii]PUZ24647.1 universal stress protein [Chitinophaga costaii]SCC31083.1 Nucleotide-binding universal stress protein, UspA family [Chitinophaga costaii]
MKTLLIPVDFTTTTDNAVTFGGAWAKRYDYERIILLKTFYDNVFDNIVVSAEYAPVNQEYRAQERQEAREKLDQLCERLRSLAGPGVTVVTAESEAPLLRSILELVQAERPEMILLGSDDYKHTTGSFIAGHVISIAKASPVRVLIVPASYTYRPVEKALVPYDYNALYHLSKLNALKTSPLWGDVKLLVLNIDPKERYRNPDEAFRSTEADLHNYLQNFNFSLHYRNDQNIIGGIIEFTKEHDVQLILAMPGHYSFLYSLTHKSISEGIYRNARVPVLILK